MRQYRTLRSMPESARRILHMLYTQYKATGKGTLTIRGVQHTLDCSYENARILVSKLRANTLIALDLAPQENDETGRPRRVYYLTAKAISMVEEDVSSSLTKKVLYEGVEYTVKEFFNPADPTKSIFFKEYKALTGTRQSMLLSLGNAYGWYIQENGETKELMVQKLGPDFYDHVATQLPYLLRFTRNMVESLQLAELALDSRDFAPLPT